VYRRLVSSAPVRWTSRIFGASWIAYFSYYFTRKHFSVVKSSLGISENWLGYIDLGYLIGYATGQFGAGIAGDKFGPRKLVTFGMLASAVLSVVFACAGFVTTSVLGVYLACSTLNGLVQASGWPGNGKLMATWFSSARRAEIMGVWTTCYPAGGLITNVVAGWLLGWGWRTVYIGMATWVTLVAITFWLVVRDRPSDVGYDDPEVPAGTSDADRKKAFHAAWPRILRDPLTWALGLCYFGHKIVRYGFLFWLPYYLNTSSLHYGKGEAAIVAIAFEAGGIPFSIVAGLVADRLFGRRRIFVACICSGGLIASLFLYAEVGATSVAANVLALALVGAFLFAADTLVSGVASQDLGGPHAAALACGIINGLGSLGAVLQAVTLVPIKQHYGWDSVFTMFEAAAALSFIALIPFARTKPPEVPVGTKAIRESLKSIEHAAETTAR
jgi:MFS transporter, OPA family, sugar phosphate sensor protein UhpC